MKPLRPYVPALTLSFYACAGDPSQPSTPPVASEVADAGISESRSDARSSVSPASTVAAHSSLEMSEAEASTSSSTAETSRSTPPNGSTSAAESSTNPSTLEHTSGEAEEIDAEPPPPNPLGTRNFACAPSPSPMFQGRELLDMRITADFSVVNGNDKETAVSPGRLDPDGSGPLSDIPIEVHARGISRFRDCGFRPFKVKFAEKQKGNVFQKLGKSVKFSTHCGDREGMHEILKAPSLDEYYQRVRMEHLVYQLLGPLQTLSLATRLVRVTYEDTSTNSVETHLAFVREPEDELGQRCGMLEGEDIPDVPTPLNERANLLLYLVNNFVIQADVKNRFDLVNVEAQLRSSVPYDFDLLGIFRREYAGLDGRTLAQNAEAFADWLRRNQSPSLHEEVKLLLSGSEEMRRLVADAELTPTNRALFDEWLDSFLGVLATFDECESSEHDPNAVACFVPDDHSNNIEGATSTVTGEHSVLLEPPGDRDTLLVELGPNQLYTLTTQLETILSSPTGEVVGVLGRGDVSPAMALSLRTEAGGTYGVEFARGGSLVCSDMWNNAPESLAHPYAIYEDDHGGTLASATPLAAGTITAGQFELSTLQGLFDEDWFTLTIAPTTRVFVDSDGADSAFIEIYRSGAASAALDTHFLDTQGAREELTALFPEPGEYVLHAIQGWDQATYSLEVLETDE